MLARTFGRPIDAQEAEHLKALRRLPVAVRALERQVVAWSEPFARRHSALFLSHGLQQAISARKRLRPVPRDCVRSSHVAR